MGRIEISLKVSAVSRINSISSGSSCLMPSKSFLRNCIDRFPDGRAATETVGDAARDNAGGTLKRREGVYIQRGNLSHLDHLCKTNSHQKFPHFFVAMSVLNSIGTKPWFKTLRMPLVALIEGYCLKTTDLIFIV